jgi:hypothetical protein
MEHFHVLPGQSNRADFIFFAPRKNFWAYVIPNSDKKKSFSTNLVEGGCQQLELPVEPK